MVGGATFVTIVSLAAEFLIRSVRLQPLAAALRFWPETAAVLVSAGLLSIVIRTRLLPVYILIGMVALMIGGALAAATDARSSTGMLVAMALLGFGSGATVSPGLYMAGFSLPSALVGRILALIELVRSVADFVLAPVMIKIGQALSGGQPIRTSGLQGAIELTLGLTALCTLFGAALYVSATTTLQQPDLEGWLSKGATALRSPPLLARLRERRKGAHDADR
jgi:hypothetical protein